MQLPVENVIDFIPQRSPMVMIDSLESADENHGATSLCIDAQNIFVEDGELREPGLIENIAQTAAAQVGFLSKQKNTPIPIGYIAAIRHLVIVRRPLVGDRIKTLIKQTNQIGNIILLEGEILLEDDVICSCEMRVFISR